MNEEVLKLLKELLDNCGDSRGRDGEYLSDQVQQIVDKLNATDEVGTAS